MLMSKQFLHKDKAIPELAFPALSTSNIMEADGDPGDSGPQFSNKYLCSVTSYYSFETTTTKHHYMLEK